MKEKKTCLVTGGAGFIGSHLCETLLKKDYRVICIDNLITGNRKNITPFLSNPYFQFIKHDITNPNSQLLIANYQFIYHLASPASPVKYQRYAIETMLTNSLGTYYMLKLALQHKAKFLLASTSEVYGDPQKHPQTESYWGNVNPVGKRSCYDESKRFAESLTTEFIRKKKLNARIIRIFNTYGPRMEKEDGRVISNFINQAISTKPITIYGDGSQTRSFCFISDMVDGIKKAMEKEKTEGEVINLGNPDEKSIKEIAIFIKKATTSSSPIVHKDLPADDPTKRKPDITKAQQLLNWQPQIDFEEGLQKTINYFKSI